MEAEEYERMAAAGATHWWYRATRQLLAQMNEPFTRELGPSAVALDAGGGTGATGSWLASRCLTVLDDIETGALKWAVADQSGFVGVRADLNHLPHVDNSFDVVLCVTALCHTMNPDPAAIVAEFGRITAPGGVVCLMEPGGRRLWRSHDDVTHTARRFSRSDLRTMLSAAGLDVIRATGAYLFLVPPAWLLGKLERGAAKSDVGRNESGMFGLFTGLAAIERRILRKRDLPGGLSVIAIGRKPSER
jgi:SAM-dependent methyltransferase